MERIKKNSNGEQPITQIDFGSLDLTNFNGKIIQLKEGESLYKTGDEALSFFLILDGSIELAQPDILETESQRIFNKNEYFGLVEVIKKCKRQSDSIAKFDSTLLEFTSKYETPAFESTLKSEPKYDLLFKTAAHRYSKSSAFLYDITEEKRNGIAIISINQHRCNFLSAPELKNYLFQVIERGEKKIIVDLQQCRIIDSTYLGALVASLRKISYLGGDLRLVCNQTISNWLFVVTKMDKVFRIFKDPEDAINSFSS